jgi:predicted DsbA family dithiol-disulfide isomerase
MISATLFNDPACPWAYSENPALRVIEWRYRDQLRWRLVLIGLTESAAQYEARGYTPLGGALGRVRFRRYGMPFSTAPKARVSATARACRAVVAARIIQPGGEWSVFRALQLANFTSALLLDDDSQLAEVLRRVPGVDADEIASRLDSAEVTEAYERDRAEARTAAGSAAELQGKTATTDGAVRFTAPSVVFERDGLRMEAGGFQPVQAYDALIVNLDPSLERHPVPDSPEPLLEYFDHGLTTQEVAALLARDNDPPDRVAAEAALLEVVAAAKSVREPLGDDAVWRAAGESARHRSSASAVRSALSR